MVKPGGVSVMVLLVERDDDLLLDSEGYQEDGCKYCLDPFKIITTQPEMEARIKVTKQKYLRFPSSLFS